MKMTEMAFMGMILLGFSSGCSSSYDHPQKDQIITAVEQMKPYTAISVDFVRTHKRILFLRMEGDIILIIPNKVSSLTEEKAKRYCKKNRFTTEGLVFATEDEVLDREKWSSICDEGFSWGKKYSARNLNKAVNDGLGALSEIWGIKASCKLILNDAGGYRLASSFHVDQSGRETWSAGKGTYIQEWSKGARIRKMVDSYY